MISQHYICPGGVGCFWAALIAILAAGTGSSPLGVLQTGTAGATRCLPGNIPQTPRPVQPPAGSSLFPEVAQGPLSPEESMARMKLPPGLSVQLVAAEPQVADPVAIAFDEDGRLWVVEMADYPDGPPLGRPPLSRIRVLEDRDDDGHYELSRIFADCLLFPNGVLPWMGGVIVTAAPHILYLKDTDGDGRADLRQVLFEGFATENPQLRVNHPTFGLDNWIYVANGLRGGSVRPVAVLPPPSAPGGEGKGEKVHGDDVHAAPQPLNISGRDFRFRLMLAPAGRQGPSGADHAVAITAYEAIAGMGQFGLTFDDWGRRFVCDNAHHLRFVVVEDRYVRRNPYLAVSELIEDIPDHGAQAKVFALGRNWTTSNLHAGHFTAACGVHVYRGDLLGGRLFEEGLLPEDYRGNVFVCEPPGNLIHRDILEPAGATLVARRAETEKEREFLASTDDWFRPVNLATGPDGALYVVDMYRAIIEHPEFMPEELKGRAELTLGRGRGRIYRIAPDGPAEAERRRRVGSAHPAGPGEAPGVAPPRSATARRPRLSGATTAELVELLAHPNAWWRETAQRVLIERQDQAALPCLEKTLAVADDPRTRLHAAWTLEGLGALKKQHVLRLLRDAEPRVREQAIVLAEPMLRAGESEVTQHILATVSDSDARVRFQASLSLGELPGRFRTQHPTGTEFLSALAEVSARDTEDRWLRIAVASSLQDQEAASLLIRLLIGTKGYIDDASTHRLAFVRELAGLVGSRHKPNELQALVGWLFQHDPEPRLPWHLATLEGLVHGAQRRGGDLTSLVGSLPQPHRDRMAVRLKQLFGRVAELARRDDQSLEMRREAIEVLGQAPTEIAQPVLTGLLGTQHPQEIQTAAVRALGAHQEAEIPNRLLEHWKAATPPVKREIAAALLRSAERVSFLLDKIQEGQLQPSELTQSEVRQLLDHPQGELQARARGLLSDLVPKDRREVLAKYQPALELPADPQLGRAVFQKNCATCHRVAGIGVDVAPDISDSRTRTPQALLNDILNPNAAIDSNYVQYTVTTRDGRVLTGVIASETASSLTLRRAEDQRDTVLRQDIEQIASTGTSLMPEGLEKDIPPQEMAHLISFLKNWRYLEAAGPVAPSAP